MFEGFREWPNLEHKSQLAVCEANLGTFAGVRELPVGPPIASLWNVGKDVASNGNRILDLARSIAGYVIVRR